MKKRKNNEREKYLQVQNQKKKENAEKNQLTGKNGKRKKE